MRHLGAATLFAAAISLGGAQIASAQFRWRRELLPRGGGREQPPSISRPVPGPAPARLRALPARTSSPTTAATSSSAPRPTRRPEAAEAVVEAAAKGDHAATTVRLRAHQPACCVQCDRDRLAIDHHRGGRRTMAIRRPPRTLATYRSQFGLPACTTANGCFARSTTNVAQRPACRRRTWAGTRNRRSTSTWKAPCAQTARSSSSRRTRPATTTWRRP